MVGLSRGNMATISRRDSLSCWLQVKEGEKCSWTRESHCTCAMAGIKLRLNHTPLGTLVRNVSYCEMIRRSFTMSCWASSTSWSSTLPWRQSWRERTVRHTNNIWRGHIRWTEANIIYVSSWRGELQPLSPRKENQICFLKLQQLLQKLIQQLLPKTNTNTVKGHWQFSKSSKTGQTSRVVQLKLIGHLSYCINDSNTLVLIEMVPQ